LFHACLGGEKNIETVKFLLERGAEIPEIPENPENPLSQFNYGPITNMRITNRKIIRLLKKAKQQRIDQNTF
jgi:hypothetical protein